MLNLSRNAAKQIQNWMVQQNNEFGWFEDDGVPANDKERPEARQAEAPQAEATIVPATLSEDAPASTPAETPSAADLANAAAEVIEEPTVAPPAE